MSEPLLSIRNHHAPACGDPPIVNSDDPNVYIGYFGDVVAELSRDFLEPYEAGRFAIAVWPSKGGAQWRR
jgi:hypothetical protein